MANYNMGSSDMDGMGGAMALIVAVFVLIWAALRHSDAKIQNNAIQQNQQRQAQAKAGFTRQFGEGNFDSQDMYLGEQVVDYARAGGDKFETVKHVAGLFGTMKEVVAKESSQATAKLIQSQIENNRQNRQEPPAIPQQPVYIAPGQPQQPQQPIYIEQPREPRRRVRYIDEEPEYIYRPRPGRPYGHYDY